MLKRKRIREKGKLSFSKFFQRFEKGDSVALVRDLGEIADFPKRMQGKTGKVRSKRGRAYEVEVKDYDKLKVFMVKPIHLKKIEVK